MVNQPVRLPFSRQHPVDLGAKDGVTGASQFHEGSALTRRPLQRLLEHTSDPLKVFRASACRRPTAQT